MGRPKDLNHGGEATHKKRRRRRRKKANVGVDAHASGTIKAPHSETTTSTSGGGDRGGGGGGGPRHPNRKPKGAPKAKEDKLSPREIEREYGFAYNFFKSDDELWDLLQKAIKNHWSPGRFQAHLQDTKWFKKHSDIWRTNTALKYTDPETFHERLNNYKTQVKALAGRYGADLTQRELDRYAERAYLFGWSEQQIVNHIAKEVHPTKAGHYQGQLATVEQQLRETALNNGVRVPPQQLKKWMRQIVRGNSSMEQYQTYIRDLAANTFGAYGREIKSGMDLIDIASPYIQSMADILELNPNDITLYDRTIRRALSYKDKDGNPAPMSITDFEDSLRYDKRWQYTDNARETMKGYAVELGKLWGVLS